MTSPKYPRTPHFPWSPGGTSDDRRLLDVSGLLNVPVVITEKLDGSNVCLESEAVYARSHGNVPSHPSFDLLKAFHAQVKGKIPSDTQVFGEWLYARHSIAYDSLPHYLAIFGVRFIKDTPMWASWEEVELWAEELGCPTAPVLARTTSFSSKSSLEESTVLLSSRPSSYGPTREGCVVRVASEFSDDHFGLSVAKWVRAGHVQTDEHWSTQEIVRNGLKK
jgi:hypothetical protein